METLPSAEAFASNRAWPVDSASADPPENAVQPEPIKPVFGLARFFAPSISWKAAAAILFAAATPAFYLGELPDTGALIAAVLIFGTFALAVLILVRDSWSYMISSAAQGDSKHYQRAKELLTFRTGALNFLILSMLIGMWSPKLWDKRLPSRSSRAEAQQTSAVPPDELRK